MPLLIPPLRLSPSPSPPLPRLPAHPTIPVIKPTKTSPPAGPGSAWGGHATHSQLRLHFKFPTWLRSCRLPLAATIPTAFPARVLAGSEYSPTTHSLHVARRQLPCSWPRVSCETCRHAGNSLGEWGWAADVAGRFWGQRPVSKQACVDAAGVMGQGGGWYDWFCCALGVCTVQL